MAEHGEQVGIAMVNVPTNERAALVEVLNRYGRSHPTGMLSVPEGLLEAEVTFTERTVSGKLREPSCRSVRLTL